MSISADKAFISSAQSTALKTSGLTESASTWHIENQRDTWVILTATWGTGTRSGATIGKEIEKKGNPVITCLSNVATQVRVGRILGGSKFHYPVRQPELPPEEELRWRIGLLDKGLTALETPVKEPKVF